MLTAGGLAPCLSAAVANLIIRYNSIDPDVEIIAYKDGFKGLLLGDVLKVDDEIREQAYHLLQFGGSPIGSSSVMLLNAEDCVKRKLIKEGEVPFEVAAQQLVKDRVDVLHTIGGDGTNLTAANLAAHLSKNNYSLQVIGLPKTIDNDIFPVKQTLGAWTAAEQGAIFFENVVAEHSANPRTLIVHEVMGRYCGWLSYATAKSYMDRLKTKAFLPKLGFPKEKRTIHGLYLPELSVDLEAEKIRLKKVMDTVGCVNVFVSEGAFINYYLEDLKKEGKEIPKNEFGQLQLKLVNIGDWLGKKLGPALQAGKVLIQKSGYFTRSAAPNILDLNLIQSCVDLAVECAFKNKPGLIGQDEENQNRLRCIEFSRVSGAKPFNVSCKEFQDLMKEVHQL